MRLSAFLLMFMAACSCEPENDGRAPLQHRTEPICDHVRSPGSGGDVEGCQNDAECTEGENGRCYGTGRDYSECSYDRCFSDDECSGACSCGQNSEGNLCVGGNCQVDADCGANGYCSPSLSDNGRNGRVSGYFCHTPEDECINHDECADYCGFSEEQEHWVCLDALEQEVG